MLQQFPYLPMALDNLGNFLDNFQVKKNSAKSFFSENATIALTYFKNVTVCE